MPSESLAELVQSVRARVMDELDAQLRTLAARHEAEIAAARHETEVETERRIAAMTPPPPPAQDVSARALAAFDRIASADTASDMLTAIASAAAECATSARVFVGTKLDPWPPDAGTSAGSIVQEGFTTGRTVRKDVELAVPLLLDGEAVGVLYAPSVESDRDVHAIEGIARFASAQLTALTAVRTVHAHRWLRGAGRTAHSTDAAAADTAAEDEDTQAARRYARLLVSEIKLYNESAVNEGRTQRDLSRRLSTEIDRARRLYEERVPSTVAERNRYFHHELIQTLAGGDSTLFG